MRSVYGELVLPKGTTLYHSSQEPFAANPRKPMLFTTFHPSDWYVFREEYITPITLQRDVSLFFMVGGFNGYRVLSLLDTLIGQPGNNLAKQRDQNLACYARHLRAEGFDGWFSTIEGKATVEVALLNSPDIFTAGESEQFHTANWNDDRVRPDVLERFGSRFPISLVRQPATLRINERFRADIDAYLGRCSKSGGCVGTVHLLLSTADIHYSTAPAAYIAWDC